MISKKVEKAFNDQINAELASAYLYLSMAAWFGTQNLPGFASWMKTQAQEEVKHAMKFYDHIEERDGTVKLLALTAPQLAWTSPLKAFEAAYKHEQYITDRIHKLVKMARAENDYAAEPLLQWFVEEQIEEEDSTRAIAEKLKMIGDHSGHLLMLDRELGKRESE
jgi:ferritin